MAAPGGVELYKNVFVGFHYNVFVVVRYDDFDGPVLLFGDGFALDAGLDLAVDEVLDEVTDFFLCELLALIQGELLVLDSLLDGKRGPLVDFEVQVASVGAKGFGVNDGEVDLAFVFLGNWLEGLC